MPSILEARAPLVGQVEKLSPDDFGSHAHPHHQLMFATAGVLHVRTNAGQWILPPSRAAWIRGGTEHGLIIKRPATVTVLYMDPGAYDFTFADDCEVLSVSPLVRELIAACTTFPWDYSTDSRQARLARVLVDELQSLQSTLVDLPLPTDSRALLLVELLESEPDNRETLAQLAGRVGASARTLERIFARETHMPFGVWRYRQRMLVALERLAYGESVTRVALEVGYASSSSFVAAFRTMFATTPARYFCANAPM